MDICLLLYYVTSYCIVQQICFIFYSIYFFLLYAFFVFLVIPWIFVFVVLLFNLFIRRKRLYFFEILFSLRTYLIFDFMYVFIHGSIFLESIIASFFLYIAFSCNFVLYIHICIFVYLISVFFYFVQCIELRMYILLCF